MNAAVVRALDASRTGTGELSGEALVRHLNIVNDGRGQIRTAYGANGADPEADAELVALGVACGRLVLLLLGEDGLRAVAEKL